MHLFKPKFDDVNITNDKGHNKKPRDQRFTSGPSFYK